MAGIILTYNSSVYEVKANGGVTVSLRANNVIKPDANGSSASKAQTQTWENPTYTINGVELTEASGTLTYAVLLDMMKHKYDGTNAITLKVNYGDSASKYLVSSDGSTTEIPVVFDSASPKFGLKSHDNGTMSAYIPVFNIIFKETA